MTGPPTAEEQLRQLADSVEAPWMATAEEILREGIRNLETWERISGRDTSAQRAYLAAILEPER